MFNIIVVGYLVTKLCILCLFYRASGKLDPKSSKEKPKMIIGNGHFCTAVVDPRRMEIDYHDGMQMPGRTTSVEAKTALLFRYVKVIL